MNMQSKMQAAMPQQQQQQQQPEITRAIKK